MWNLQEKGSSRHEVLTALHNHPHAKPRQASVEGVTVTIPQQIPEETLAAIAALLGELPEPDADQVIVLSAWSEGTTLNVNVALETAAA